MLQKKTVEPITFSFLEKLAKKAQLKGFYLVGGTALSLQLGHRISTDLDFFSQTDFNNEPIRSMLEIEDKDLVYARVGKNLVQATINGIKVDFACHKYPILRPGIDFHKIKIMSIADISAMKLGAILSRAKKRDYVDIARIMKDYDLNKILEFFKNKYNQKNTFHVVKALGYFVEADQDIEYLKVLGKSYSWENSKKIIIDGIHGLGRTRSQNQGISI